jgi:hypothetical protein
MIGGTVMTAAQLAVMSDEDFGKWVDENPAEADRLMGTEPRKEKTMGNSTKTKGGGKAAPAPVSMSPKGGGHPVGGMASVKGGGSKGGSKGGRYK